MAANAGVHIVSIPGLKAGLTLAAKQYQVVKFASTAASVVAVLATTDAAIGIVQNDPAAGEAALVAGPGSIAIGLAGAADLAAGELVGFNTSAQVVDHTTDNRRIIGQVLDASTAVGDQVRVYLTGLTRY